MESDWVVIMLLLILPALTLGHPLDNRTISGYTLCSNSS